MPSLDQILAPQDPAPVEPGSIPAGWAGTVLVAPDADDLIRVMVPGYSTDLGEICRYVAPAGPPVAGDACLVLFADQGLPWALLAGAGVP